MALDPLKAEAFPLHRAFNVGLAQRLRDHVLLAVDTLRAAGQGETHDDEEAAPASQVPPQSKLLEQAALLYWATPPSVRPPADPLRVEGNLGFPREA